jgi:hypothetical protein
MGFLNQLGLYGLASIPLQPQNLWTFFILPDPSNLSVSSLASTINSVETLMSPLVLAQLCQKVNLPFQQFEIENHPGTNIKYLAKASPLEDISVEFLETGTHSIQKYALGWQNEQYDSKHKLFHTGNHKRLGILTIFPAASLASDILGSVPGAGNVAKALDSVLDTIPSGIYEFVGLAYKGIQPHDNSYEEGGHRRVTMSLTVDRINRIGDFTSVLSLIPGL